MNLDTATPAYTQMAATAEARAILGDSTYDFYRCHRCHRLITQPEMLANMARHDGQACRGRTGFLGLLGARCNSYKITPVGPNIGMWWGDWLKPRVLHFAVQRLRGRA